MDSMNKLKDFGTDENLDSGFLSSSGIFTTESDLTTSQSDYQIQDPQDSGVDISARLSKLELATNINDYPDWEYFIVPDGEGDNQLHIGVMEGYYSAVSTLITLIPHPSILDFQNNLLQTALHISVLTKQPSLTYLLAKSGARIDMTDANGNTPLHLAAENGDAGCLQALTEGTFSYNRITASDYETIGKQLPSIDLINYDGLAPIHLAAKNGHCDVIRALNWLGADLNVGDLKGGRTPLHYAIAHEQLHAAHCLINECGSGLEVETYGGNTPYDLARDCRSSRIAEDLIAVGAIAYESMDESESDESDSEL